MKILLISINSITELTGGGIYLRTLKSLYEMSGHKVDIFSKNSPDYHVKKNIFTDLIGRLVFCPSYIGAYIFKILVLARKYDVIAFHSTRLGLLGRIISIFFKNKKIIFHSDNVEANLIKDLGSNTGLPKKILIFIDSFLIPYSECSSMTCSEIITFITAEDKYAMLQNGCLKEKHKSFVVPVLLQSECPPSKSNGDFILFTGSFDFYPNQHAFLQIIKVASKNKHEIFVVAGRGLNNFIAAQQNVTLPSNVKVYSDLEPTEMTRLYQEAKLYLCPVKFGSGMKTKIAEALSYNLYVIADIESTFGYKDAIDNLAVIPVNSIFFDEPGDNNFKEILETIASLRLTNKTLPYSVFNKFYSLDSGIESFRRNVL